MRGDVGDMGCAKKASFCVGDFFLLIKNHHQPFSPQPRHTINNQPHPNHLTTYRTL